MYDPTATTYTHARVDGVIRQYNGYVYHAIGSSYGDGQSTVVHESATAINGIKFYPSSDGAGGAAAGFDRGTIRLYGLKNS